MKAAQVPKCSLSVSFIFHLIQKPDDDPENQQVAAHRLLLNKCRYGHKITTMNHHSYLA